MTAKWLKKKDCLVCQNLEASKAGHDSFEHWQNFSDWQKFAKFLKLGIALILCYFLKDFLA